MIRAFRDGDASTRVLIAAGKEHRVRLQLRRSINETIGKIAAYTRELERRRSEADRAFQEADDTALARDALVHSLTEDLDGPLRLMHAELTSAALSNTDPSLKARIKEALALLQDARASFTDLMEIATSHRLQPKPHDDLGELLSDLERDVRLFAQSVNMPVSFTVTQHPRNDGTSKLLVDIDGVRLRSSVNASATSFEISISNMSSEAMMPRLACPLGYESTLNSMFDKSPRVRHPPAQIRRFNQN